MRRKAKIDANQNEIVKQLRQIPGVSVAITSQLGNGFPDLVVGFRMQNYLIELKDGSKPPSAKRLTTDEGKFAANWYGRYNVCECLEDVLQVLGL